MAGTGKVGRPPLSEAEKARRAATKKRQQQRAKEKRHAKTVEKNKKYVQKKIAERTRVRRKIMAATKEAIDKKRIVEADADALVAALEGVEERRVQAQIITDYFSRFEKVDWDNAVELQDRIDFFFECCIKAKVSPVPTWLALVLGCSEMQIRYVLRGERRDGSIQQEILRKAVMRLKALWEYDGDNGQVNPAAWIFKGKNYFGMKDQAEVTVTQQQSPLGDSISVEQLQAKYKAALPKGIDVEYTEVKEEGTENEPV